MIRTQVGNGIRRDIATPAEEPPGVSASAEWPVAGRVMHLVGIGGCGMYGLARLLRDRGARVEGSGRAPTELTERLRDEAGIAVSFDQDAGRLPEACEIVIASAAIPPDHPELLAAAERGIETLVYAEALGRLMRGRTGVSIAGTHGKSTTTALLAHVLIACGRDPSFIVGAMCPSIGGGSRVGADRLAPPDAGVRGPTDRPGVLLAEACEFRRSFHHHEPTMAAILNVEEDHLDIYGTLDAIVEAFAEFAARLPDADRGGYLLVGHETAHRSRITRGLACRSETIGLSSQADWTWRYDPETSRVTLAAPAPEHAEVAWRCPMPGEHNACDAAVAVVLAHRLGCDLARAAEAAGTFAGIDRRMQPLGTRAVPGGSVTVYDDYGHHPTEIESTLRALRVHERPERLVCVFQPHQHSRTRFLLDQFATSFEAADVVIVPHIYFVRDSEAEKQKVSAADLVDRLRRRGVQAMHLYPFAAIVEQLENVCRPGDLLVVMGAGPVWEVARAFMAAGE